MSSEITSEVLDEEEMDFEEEDDDEDDDDEIEEEEDDDDGEEVTYGRRTGRGLTLKTLLKEGILEPGEGHMTINYLGNKFKGDLLPDGRIRSQETNKVFGTPSAWAIYCKKIVNPDKKSGCGWASVRYCGRKLDSYKNNWFRQKRLEYEREEEEEPVEEEESEVESVGHPEQEIVEFEMLGNRHPNHDMNTLVELTTFQLLGRMQPFIVTMSSSAVAVIDVHGHLTSSEVVGYLAGQWDVNNHNLIVSHAFPLKCRLGDGDRGNMVEQLIFEEMKKLKLSLVGWYHSHPFSASLPTLRDIDSQLDYEMKMKGSNDASYTPCIGIIISPYVKESCIKSGLTAFWVIPPSEQKPFEYGRPVTLQYTIVQDAFIPKEALVHMKEAITFYKDAPDSVCFADVFQDNISHWDKLKIALHVKVPKDHITPLLEFLAKQLDSKLVSDLSIPLYEEVKESMSLKMTENENKCIIGETSATCASPVFAEMKNEENVETEKLDETVEDMEMAEDLSKESSKDKNSELLSENLSKDISEEIDDNSIKDDTDFDCTEKGDEILIEVDPLALHPGSSESSSMQGSPKECDEFAFKEATENESEANFSEDQSESHLTSVNEKCELSEKSDSPVAVPSEESNVYELNSKEEVDIKAAKQEDIDRQKSPSPDAPITQEKLDSHEQHHLLSSRSPTLKTDKNISFSTKEQLSPHVSGQQQSKPFHHQPPSQFYSQEIHQSLTEHQKSYNEANFTKSSESTSADFSHALPSKSQDNNSSHTYHSIADNSFVSAGRGADSTYRLHGSSNSGYLTGHADLDFHAHKLPVESSFQSSQRTSPDSEFSTCKEVNLSVQRDSPTSPYHKIDQIRTSPNVMYHSNKTKEIPMSSQFLELPESATDVHYRSRSSESYRDSQVSEDQRYSQTDLIPRESDYHAIPSLSRDTTYLTPENSSLPSSKKYESTSVAQQHSSIHHSETSHSRGRSSSTSRDSDLYSLQQQQPKQAHIGVHQSQYLQAAQAQSSSQYSYHYPQQHFSQYEDDPYFQQFQVPYQEYASQEYQQQSYPQQHYSQHFPSQHQYYQYQQQQQQPVDMVSQQQQQSRMDSINYPQ